MKRWISMVSILVLVMSSTAVLAQDRHVGRVDLSPMADAIGSSPKVNINFGPAMMKGFAESFRGNSPELANLIASVSGLRLMVFEDAESGPARGRIAETTSALERAGWTPAVEVRDGGDHVDLFLNESDQYVEGLVLVVTEDGGSAVFANIYGDLDPVMIGKLIGSGDALKSLDFGNFAAQFKSMAENGGDES
ncbi:MAG: DUF4252 domain-containing protein [Candidatus Wenzhouxiangella sp. M2_3B_020]